MGGRKLSGIMSGGKPVLVVVMYSPRTRIRWGSDHKLASWPREQTSFSWRSRSLDRAGQESMACRNVSGAISAPRTGEVEVFVGPGWVGSQVAFRRSHLMDSSCHKLPQAHEGVGGEGGGVVGVWRSGVFFRSILEKHVPSPGP